MLPDQTAATFANYTSYSRGINGVMVDIGDRLATGDITEADFVFWAFTDYRVQTIQLDCDKWYKPCKEEKGYLAYVEGFALSPDDYIGGFSSRDDLRAKAHWQWMVGSTTRISRPERRSRKLVKEFHEQTIHRTASR